VTHAVKTRAVPLEPGRDMLMTLQRWVEDGIAPEGFLATGLGGDGGFTGTRLLCPEPAVARYAGEGDPRDAANWQCTTRETHR
jgi:feruloyl esterase